MTLKPFLMFTGQAEEAMNFYVSSFPDAEILALERHGGEEPEREGSVKTASFRIADQTLLCIDSPDVHAFGFTPSVSFFFDCPDEASLDTLFALLSDQGQVMMPPGEYPFAKKYAWLSDRFGVSWQLSVSAR
ncbi:VOC family protein [Arthrobacter livingstonensis]|uniref:VOC family protein n=1 Tax=Arthrobacter livingstonensis TaxID=670078 RepID=A0A2V5L6E5_9MICC|nr:VOC family protein [Arthrobacter livingstonensis]PYI67101.1 VOC family protein [Arthrobacter livingstonensis]